jgi:glycosidase
MCLFYTLIACFMKRYLLSLVLLCVITASYSQRLLNWSPEFPVDNSTLAFTVDCTKGNQGLNNFEGGNSANVYVHVGVITNLSTGPTDWKYTKFTWGTADPLAKATPLGNNKYQYTITNIRSFFGVPAGETIKKVTVIFRNATGTLKQVNSDVSDMYIPVYGNSEFAVRLNLPPFEPRYIPWIEPITVNVGGTISITGVSSANAALTLKLNGNNINTAANANTISATPTITVACNQKVMLEGNDGSGIKKDSFEFYIPPTTTVAALPAGAVQGINYAANNTSATLVLYAPGKSSVVVLGDFSNWAADCANQMNKTPDGNYFWITINGLTPGTEYGYQYLIDNAIKTADPYTQKILDPNNDQFINAVTYPNLKAYPTGLTTGIVGILQTAEPVYNWQVNNFNRPDKKNLVTYELLIRDFTAAHSYQSLIDSFQYFKNLGINAIELMPINEFTGNESWGYNPTFYFAPDKYYGTKNKLKEFIDKCHLNGIAVILDVVYNHCDNEAPQAKMYWNSSTSQPAANNPWLNITAPHPYSVFNDFNHTSTATQYLVQRSLDHWLNEYKVDGFRFDLAKGFTQVQTNTTTVENYDATRVVNLKRYYDGTIVNHPNTYMILEFLGTLPCQEEQEYAAHGFMLWGNNNFVYNQCTMGFASNSDISPIVYSDPKKAYNNPAEMGYMESHDEERTMYKNLTFGNSSGSYNVKNLPTALAREEAAATVFFTVPGPKMIWQFEERGYDIPLTFGGSNVAPKPPHWEYMQDANRKHLYDTYKSIIDLRLNNPAVFNNTTFTYDFFNGGGLVKLFQIADPNATGKKITVVANLDVVQQTKAITFQSTGDWTNYISNGTGTGINGATNANFTLSAAAQTITLQPGEYHIYVSVPACATAAPTVVSPVNYCQNATAVPLTATGTNLLWYTVPTGGTGSPTAPTPATTTVGSTTYYVTQNTGCESPRAPIVVNVTATTPAPTVTPTVTYCQNATATALTATGTNLLWYTSPTGGVGSTTAPVPLTTTAGNSLYYVSQTQNCGESPRALITVTVNATPAAPAVTSPVTYCQNITAVALTATGTNLLWYTASTGGTGSATAPVPVTTAAGNTIYYVSQSTNSCEGARAAITVTVNPAPIAPTVTATVNYCQNAAAVPLIATGTNLKWYTVATGGTSSAAAPTPSTTVAGSTSYYVSQTNNGCESPRATITVNVTALAVLPTVISTVSYCQNAVAIPLTATGTNLLWYATATGGTGTANAPTPSTAVAGNTIYYVSQSNNCGESPRASITVTVVATPALATGLNVTGITTSAAVLNWIAVNGIYYSVDYKPSTATAWINVVNNITTASISLSNLSLGTTYDWRVSANCSASTINNYAVAQFSTTSHNNTINDQKNGFGIKISPNPVTGAALINYIVPGNGTVSIVLIDAFGQQLKALFNANQAAGQYNLPVTNELNRLSKGCYFLRIQQNGKGYFTQFIKQ